MNRYFNQGSTYAQAGQAVHADAPIPGDWRICLVSNPGPPPAVGIADLYSGYQVFKNTLKVGIPTAVRVTSFRGRADGRKGVTLTWRAASEFGALGYNVWRFGGGQGVKVTHAMIAAKPAEFARGATYRVLDRSARRGVAYTYRLQVVKANGARAWAARTVVRLR